MVGFYFVAEVAYLSIVDLNLFSFISKRFVGDLLETGDGGWIGLNDKSQESSYIWNYQRDPVPSFSAWDKSNPKDEEPNNNNRRCNVENCVELKYTTKKWNDAVCNAHFGFVCQVYSKIGEVSHGKTHYSLLPQN